jgi:tetratricopeptide (TPR) repeat protein
MGSVFERLGSYKKAAEAFRTVLRLNPEDDAAANYLGYMWAEQGINLDSAKVLLEFALKKEPQNGAYLDSYAWIFYKMGDFDNAAFYIKKALEYIKSDPIVFEHWGDILSKKAEYTMAIDAFEKSIDLGAENKSLIKQKIKGLQDILQKPIIIDDVHK